MTFTQDIYLKYVRLRKVPQASELIDLYQKDCKKKES
jgi:hypothetical protein